MAKPSGMISTDSARSRLILPWLYLCMAMVVLMVFVGGVTRLTESGLSIVEWKLITGIFPPMTDEAWEAELDAYRTSPEYQIKNSGMNVAEFKQIYWLEWLHRLLGRTTGLVFLLPFLYFAVRRQMDGPLAMRSLIAGLLVAAQGGVGWVMVKSGLVDDPRVSPIKLASHLALAFIVFHYVLWTVFYLKGFKRYSLTACWPAIAMRAITLLVFIQILLGAIVAGLDAGLSYNTWPLMDGQWVPDGLMLLEPWHRNLVENITAVQWNHRTMAFVVSFCIILFILGSWRQLPEKKWLILLGIGLLLQFKLGVLTLIKVVPIHLASAHQMVALLLLALCIRLCYAIPMHQKQA